MPTDMDQVFSEIRAALLRGEDLEEGEFFIDDYAQSQKIAPTTAIRHLGRLFSRGLLTKRRVTVNGQTRVVYKWVGDR